MGWGRTLLLGDIGTQLNVNDVEADVAEVQRHLRDQQMADATHDQAIAALQEENREMKIYVATLVRLLVSKNVVTGEELGKFVDLVDPG